MGEAWICPVCRRGVAPWLETCPCAGTPSLPLPEPPHVHDWQLQILDDEGQLVKDCRCGARSFWKSGVNGILARVRDAEPSQGLRNCLFRGWASIPVKTDHL